MPKPVRKNLIVLQEEEEETAKLINEYKDEITFLKKALMNRIPKHYNKYHSKILTDKFRVYREEEVNEFVKYLINGNVFDKKKLKKFFKVIQSTLENKKKFEKEFDQNKIHNIDLYNEDIKILEDTLYYEIRLSCNTGFHFAMFYNICQARNPLVQTLNYNSIRDSIKEGRYAKKQKKEIPYRNDIDFDYNHLPFINITENPTTQEEAVKQFEEIMSIYFEDGQKEHTMNKSYHEIHELESIIPDKIFHPSKLPHGFSRTPDNIYLAFGYLPWGIYTLALALDKIKKANIENHPDYFQYLNAMTTLLNKIADMTSIIYHNLSFRGQYTFDDKRNFETKLTMKEIVNFNQQLIIYLKKMRCVGFSILQNLYAVPIHGNRRNIKAEDFYQVCNKMNNDPKIQNAINIVISENNKTMHHFDKLIKKARTRQK
ncbi:hypothetical protein [Borrelia persica]|uniref:hypothetical protein n=1 Tax=Borrelia persica TaxID=44448 RepID=UPI000465D918|nr:hypothetical protein [Borrelia persica]